MVSKGKWQMAKEKRGGEGRGKSESSSSEAFSMKFSVDPSGFCGEFVCSASSIPLIAIVNGS